MNIRQYNVAVMFCKICNELVHVIAKSGDDYKEGRTEKYVNKTNRSLKNVNDNGYLQ